MCLHTHPQSLGLHFEVGLQLSWGERSQHRHRIFVVVSHAAASRGLRLLLRSNERSNIKCAVHKRIQVLFIIIKVKYLMNLNVLSQESLMLNLLCAVVQLNTSTVA